MHSKKFMELILPLQNSLYRLAYAMLRNREEAEDVVQEIFYRLWSKNSMLDQLDSIRAFALKMTKNLCLDKIKGRKRVIGEIEKLNLRSNQPNPHENTEAGNLIEIVQKIISTLPQQQQLVIHLRNIEELSLDEISTVTEMSVNHVRVTLSRARRNINEIYEQQYNHE
jgi:RNA polymerase sigma factor (sigma-70 family)